MLLLLLLLVVASPPAPAPTAQVIEARVSGAAEADPAAVSGRCGRGGDAHTGLRIGGSKRILERRWGGGIGGEALETGVLPRCRD